MTARDSEALRRCPVCGGTELGAMYEVQDPRFPFPERFEIMWCDRCAVASTQPPLSSDDLRRFYPDGYDPYCDDLAERTLSPFHRLLLKVEERFAPGATDDLPVGALLDVGCGNGQYMAAMARRGFAVLGVELSAQASRLVRARGLPVTTGDFLEAVLPSASFDVITMNHYLEHALDPRASLEKAHALLKPSGRLVVGVPNFSSWARRRFGPDWSDLEAPRHVTHFTPEGLAKLLSECGFRPYKVQYVGAADSNSIVTSLFVRTGKRNDPLAHILFPLLHLVSYPIGLPLAVARDSAWMRLFATRS